MFEAGAAVRERCSAMHPTRSKEHSSAGTLKGTAMSSMRRFCSRAARAIREVAVLVDDLISDSEGTCVKFHLLPVVTRDHRAERRPPSEAIELLKGPAIRCSLHV